jgi:hypothetical protein
LRLDAVPLARHRFTQQHTDAGCCRAARADIARIAGSAPFPFRAALLSNPRPLWAPGFLLTAYVLELSAGTYLG